jgi:hypothetical protein
VRKATKELFHWNVGFPGDEDNGSMAGWYIFSAMGFYPVCPTVPQYILGSPAVKRCVIHTHKGTDFIVNAKNNDYDKVYWKDMYLNGKSYSKVFLTHSDIMEGGQVDFTMNLADEFNKLGLFDKVKIAGKSLREYGCTEFYNNYAIGINEKPAEEVPHNHIRLYCHADPEIWTAAHNSGAVSFSSDVTVEEGALFPGYAYLSGAEDATLYRAGCTFVKTSSTANYGMTSYGETDVESMEYVQGHDGNSGYLGVSLKGDDYLGDGVQVEINQNYKHQFNSFISTIELNGMKDKATYYGLYNLGEKGKGYYSFQVSISETELESITIPAGTLFPARALNGLPNANLLPSGAYGYPLIVYRTQTTQTFYRNAEGKYVSFDAYLASAKADVQATYDKKIADCFAEDVATLESTLATAKAALETATTIEDIDAAYGAAKSVYASVLTKTEAVAAATEELNAYKAEDGYFRDAEKAQRDGFVVAATANFPTATTKSALADIVTTAKAGIDALKTAAQYADEELAVVKASAREEISGYLAGTSYLLEQAGAREYAIELGLTAVADARTEAEIAAAVVTVKATIDGLETKESIVSSAKAEVNGYKADVVYRDAQASMRDGMISDALFEIDAATTQENVNKAVERAKERIDTLKTDAELTAEEKAAADEALAVEKQMALDQINAVKAGVIYKEYTTENQAKINTLYKAAKDQVANALTSEELSAAIAEFTAELDKLPKVEKTDNGASSADSANPLMGCSSVAGMSVMTALTVALGAVAFAKKRKEN